MRLQLPTDIQGLFATLGEKELRVPAEPHLINLLLALKDRLAAGTVDSIWWTDTRNMIGDVPTKGGLSRVPLLELWRNSSMEFVGDPAERLCLRKRPERSAA